MSIEDAAIGHEYRYVKDPRRLTRSLLVLLWIGAAMSLAVGMATWLLLPALGLNEPGVQQMDPDESLPQALGKLWLMSAFFLIAAADWMIGIASQVLFFVWVYRANKNCHGFGAEEMEFTPGWAVGWFFVPIVNLVAPCRMMQEMWRVSGNPRAWTAERISWKIGVWWAAFLVTGTMAVAGMLVFKESDALSGATPLVSAIHTLLTISVVTGLSARQQKLVDGSQSASIIPT